jgi:N-acetylmuramoyl-L-alanine amidase
LTLTAIDSTLNTVNVENNLGRETISGAPAAVRAAIHGAGYPRSKVYIFPYFSKHSIQSQDDGISTTYCRYEGGTEPVQSRYRAEIAPGRGRDIPAIPLQIAVSLVLILFLAACAQPQRKVTPIYSEPRPAPIQAEQPTPTPTPPPVIEPKVEPLPEPKPIVITPPEIKPAATKPVTGWVSLDDWCSANKLNPPLITKEGAQTNILVRSDNGVFEFDNRRNARWNGLLVGIGFPPQFTNKNVFVNAIDLNKVMEPLLLTNAPPRKTEGILVIDPGHGGGQDGALSHDRKLKEKTMALDWARRVEKLLEGSKWQVYLTRTNDIELTLTQRVAFTDSKKADLFISLHFNSFSNGAEAGLETYCLTPVGMSSHVTRNFVDDFKLTFPNNEHDVENLLLAENLHREMIRKTGRKDRGIRRARFMSVLRDQKRPAVLLEGGYLSNPDEAKLIATPEFRQKLAEAVAEALGVSPPEDPAAVTP